MVESTLIPRAQIIEPPQPLRMGMNEQALGELADSLKRHGLLHPLIVVPAHIYAEDGLPEETVKVTHAKGILQYRYEIVDGHRRWVAAGIAGLEELECKVYDNLDEAKYGVMLDANMMREDITAAEEGLQFVELSEKRGWSIAQLQKYFGRSESYINDRAKLVKHFPDVFQRVAARDVNWSQAKAVMRCPDPAWRAYLLDQAITHGASARTLISQVDSWKSLELAKSAQPAVHTPEHTVIQATAEKPRCLWCTRDDDPVALVSVPVHSYHLRDLQEFLQRVGINRPGGQNGS